MNGQSLYQLLANGVLALHLAVVFFVIDGLVLVSSKWARGDLFYPPYGKRFDQIVGLLKRWL